MNKEQAKLPYGVSKTGMGRTIIQYDIDPGPLFFLQCLDAVPYRLKVVTQNESIAFR